MAYKDRLKHSSHSQGAAHIFKRLHNQGWINWRGKKQHIKKILYLLPKYYFLFDPVLFTPLQNSPPYPHSFSSPNWPKTPRNPEVGPFLKNKDLIQATQKAQVHSTLHLPKVHYKACSLHPAGEEWEGEKSTVLIRIWTNDHMFYSYSKRGHGSLFLMSPGLLLYNLGTKNKTKQNKKNNTKISHLLKETYTSGHTTTRGWSWLSLTSDKFAGPLLFFCISCIPHICRYEETI